MSQPPRITHLGITRLGAIEGQGSGLIFVFRDRDEAARWAGEAPEERRVWPILRFQYGPELRAERIPARVELIPVDPADRVAQEEPLRLMEPDDGVARS